MGCPLVPMETGMVRGLVATDGGRGTTWGPTDTTVLTVLRYRELVTDGGMVKGTSGGEVLRR